MVIMYNLGQNYSVTKNVPVLNQIRTDRGNLMHKSSILSTPNCDCGRPNQTISHTVNERANRKYNGSSEDSVGAPISVVRWITILDLKF